MRTSRTDTLGKAPSPTGGSARLAIRWVTRRVSSGSSVDFSLSLPSAAPDAFFSAPEPPEGPSGVTARVLGGGGWDRA